MLALSFTFPAGRYHATPWDRHVNEGAVAWPPEPWRILRGLIATWHHKLKYTGAHNEATLRSLIESLSAELPVYRLPVASHNHTRHYMPQFGAGRASLVFDAFAAVDRSDPLIIMWQGIELSVEQRTLLDDLLSVMGYLGRAESWVDARRITDAPDSDCRPGDEALDPSTGEVKGELVTLYAPRAPADYEALRQSFLVDQKARRKLGNTLPDNLLDALSLDTADLRKTGWSQPPAAIKISYLRPIDALRPRPVLPPATARTVMAVGFLLVGRPLPRVEDALRIGELMRVAVMSECKFAFGPERIPSVFSGHGLPADNRHRHAFYLPWDGDEDGRIDRVLVYAPDGLDHGHQRALARVRRLWDRDGSDWRLVVESTGTPAAIAGQICARTTVWESATPYLHPWHVKKRFGVEDQLRRECHERGLPSPLTIEPLDEVEIGRGRKRRPIHFRRFRSKRGVAQADRLGSFWRLTFPEPVAGPVALGFACHYGLGLFRPARSTPTDP